MGSEVVEQDEQPGLLTLLEQGQRAIGIAERRTFRNLDTEQMRRVPVSLRAWRT